MFKMACCTAVVFTMCGAVSAQAQMSLDTLGEALFFDENLSLNRTQSCSSCHDPDYAFADSKRFADGAYSLGDDGVSLGDRNAPSAAYARFSPELLQDDKGVWSGGMFWDGRAAGLEEQAGGPPLNPIEMGMPDEHSVVERLQENPDYVTAFQALFGADIFDRTGDAFDGMTQAIASFERTDLFSPFDSKYDRFLQGKAELSRQEELGRVLFFSQQFTNCNLCHQLKTSPIDRTETFSNYQFHNIGVPENVNGRAENGVESGTVDEGLRQNPLATDIRHAGQFKTPTLRNVAVTGPFMHNGVFQDLRTVVLFYNRYNSRSKARQINPETGQTFGDPEVAQNLSVKELTHGPALDDQRIDALVAFLKTLTDQRYEPLLSD